MNPQFDLPPENITNMQLYTLLREVRHLQIRQAERQDEFKRDFDEHKKKVEPVIEWFGAIKAVARVALFIAVVAPLVGLLVGWIAGGNNG